MDESWAINEQITSAHNVKVSLADPRYIWAGAGMFRKPDLDIFLSRDYGKTFEPVNLFEEREMGFLTSIATHPSDPATTFLLFSMKDKPKVLRTQDYGETWTDISGFGKDSTSINGFPDVMVYSLMVFPFDEDRIWAGTEIGIFESTNGGDDWHFADNGLPSVSVWQLFIQDATIVVATHGRGIWTAQLDPALQLSPLNDDTQNLRVYPNPSDGNINLHVASPETGGYSLTVYNLSGMKVFFTSGMKLEQNLDRSVDLTGLPGGAYIVTWKINEHSVSRRVIID
jgi:hypothetical protein